MVSGEKVALRKLIWNWYIIGPFRFLTGSSKTHLPNVPYTQLGFLYADKEISHPPSTTRSSELACSHPPWVGRLGTDNSDYTRSSLQAGAWLWVERSHNVVNSNVLCMCQHRAYRSMYSMYEEYETKNNFSAGMWKCAILRQAMAVHTLTSRLLRWVLLP